MTLIKTSSCRATAFSETAASWGRTATGGTGGSECEAGPIRSERRSATRNRIATAKPARPIMVTFDHTDWANREGITGRDVLGCASLIAEVACFMVSLAA